LRNRATTSTFRVLLSKQEIEAGRSIRQSIEIIAPGSAA
jgi:hypothetical protein